MDLETIWRKEPFKRCSRIRSKDVRYLQPSSLSSSCSPLTISWNTNLRTLSACTRHSLQLHRHGASNLFSEHRLSALINSGFAAADSKGQKRWFRVSFWNNPILCCRSHHRNTNRNLICYRFGLAYSNNRCN